MKINTIVFDLDGTLLNTIEDMTDSLNKTLGEFSFPVKTIAEVKSYVGNGVRELVKKALPLSTPQETIEDVIAKYQFYYLNNLQTKTRPYDDILELLDTLTTMRYRIAVVSNKPDAGVKLLCKEYFSSYIQVAIGESKTIKKKPSSDGVLAALNELGTSVETTLYIGDSEVDIETARNANISCIGVSWGFRDKKTLQKEGCQYIIDRPLELIPLLSQLEQL